MPQAEASEEALIERSAFLVLRSCMTLLIISHNQRIPPSLQFRRIHKNHTGTFELPPGRSAGHVTLFKVVTLIGPVERRPITIGRSAVLPGVFESAVEQLECLDSRAITGNREILVTDDGVEVRLLKNRNT